MFTILLSHDGMFAGPFTDDPAPTADQTRVEITDAQKAQLESLARSEGSIAHFDGATFSVTEPVPQSIEPAQLVEWLIRHNIDPNGIYTAIDTIPDATERAVAKARWDRAVSIKRTHPLVAAVGQALQMTGEQIDQAFREAAKL